MPVTTLTSTPLAGGRGPSRPSATAPSTGRAPSGGSPPAAAGACPARSAHGGPAPGIPTNGPAAPRCSRAPAARRSVTAPTPDDRSAASRSAPPPPAASDADTIPAARTGLRAQPARRHWHSGPATGAPSAGPPHSGAPPQRPAFLLPGLPAQPGTAALSHPAPPAHPAPSLRSTCDRRQAPRMLTSREPGRSVAHLPELLSASYRNRVRKLSPRNRNQGVHDQPESHTAWPAAPRI